MQGIGRASYLWEGVGGDPAKSYVAIQLGSYLYIFNPGGGVSGETVLVSLQILPILDQLTVSMASVEGYLVIVTGAPDIFIVDSAFSLTSYRLKIRDLFGVQETENPMFEIDPQMRGGLTPQHYYNLYNQGWGIPRYPWQVGSPTLTDAVSLGSDYQAGSQSPSNSDTVWSGLDFKPIGKRLRREFHQC